MRWHRAFLSAAFLGVAVAAWPQVPPPSGSTPRPGEITGRSANPAARPRDRARRPAGTATLRGTVVAADTGAPLRRAQVRLSAPESRDGRVASTDGAGRFEFRDLAGGRYQLSASKTGFVQLSHGQRVPSDPSRTLQVGDGETLSNVALALPRAGVITGRLVDDYGEPMADVLVQAFRWQYVRGRRRLVPAGRFATSNDIGVYRVFGLAPGQYFVSAHSRGQGAGAERGEEAVGFAPTYYPGTPSASEAQPVSVSVGQEAAADFQLVPGRLARVSGTALDAAGRPLTSGTVSLTLRLEGGWVPAFGGNADRVQEDGSFTLSAVPPGTYTLTASSGGRRGSRDPGEDDERGTLPLTVYGEDVDNLVVQTTRGALVRGRVLAEDPSGTFPPQQVSLQLEARDQEDGPMSFSGRTSVAEDGTFEVRAFPGARFLRVASVPEGWQLRRVLLGGEDVTDAGFEVRPGQTVGPLRVVLTSQVTELSGTAADSLGETVRDFTVVVFPDDRSLQELPSERYVRWVRSGQDGRYRVEGLPPGEYLVVAGEELADPRTVGPDAFEDLRARAAAVAIGDGERKVVPLKVGSP